MYVYSKFRLLLIPYGADNQVDHLNLCPLRQFFFMPLLKATSEWGGIATAIHFWIASSYQVHPTTKQAIPFSSFYVNHTEPSRDQCVWAEGAVLITWEWGTTACAACLCLLTRTLFLIAKWSNEWWMTPTATWWLWVQNNPACDGSSRSMVPCFLWRDFFSSRVQTSKAFFQRCICLYCR